MCLHQYSFRSKKGVEGVTAMLRLDWGQQPRLMNLRNSSYSTINSKHKVSFHPADVSSVSNILLDTVCVEYS